jgi:hypothetical protein
MTSVNSDQGGTQYGTGKASWQKEEAYASSSGRIGPSERA